jgi:hypothetical protein
MDYHSMLPGFWIGQQAVQHSAPPLTLQDKIQAQLAQMVSYAECTTCMCMFFHAVACVIPSALELERKTQRTSDLMTATEPCLVPLFLLAASTSPCFALPPCCCQTQCATAAQKPAIEAAPAFLLMPSAPSVAALPTASHSSYSRRSSFSREMVPPMANRRSRSAALSMFGLWHCFCVSCACVFFAVDEPQQRSLAAASNAAVR